MTDAIQVGARVTWARSRFAESQGHSMSGVVRAIVVDPHDPAGLRVNFDGYEYAVVETDPDGHVTMPELSRLVVEGDEP